jgi:hypothetical protein
MYAITEIVFPVLIKSQTGEPIARINPDRTWSVIWDAVLDQAYQPFTDTNIAVSAICKILVAGRDNFRTSSWDDVQAWANTQINIDCDSQIKDNNVVLALVGPLYLVAYVNQNGQWSIDWDQVEGIRANKEMFWGMIPLAGFCELLIGAKDNFHTCPMDFH